MPPVTPSLNMGREKIRSERIPQGLKPHFLAGVNLGAEAPTTERKGGSRR
jgi:hypothetical protein